MKPSNPAPAVRSSMFKLRRYARPALLAALASAVPAAAQTTWVVDDTPGPGVDFATIVDALAVAGPFDLVDVRQGSYGPFSLVRSTRIIGEPGATVTGMSRVIGLTAGTWTFIADLSLERIRAVGVDGTLVLDNLQLTGARECLDLVNCSDVRGNRLRALPTPGGSWGGSKVKIRGGRVQLVDCLIEGKRSPSCEGTCTGTQPAQTGIIVDNGGLLMLDRCDVRGGEGDDYWSINSFPGQAGAGGTGCEVSGGSTLVCVASLVRGGDGGHSQFGGALEDGSGGPGLTADGGVHQAWNMVFEGGLRGGCCWPAPDVYLTNGAVLDTSREFPSLLSAGTPVPGGQVIIEMGGAAGDLAQIQVARLPALVPFAGSLLPRQVDIGRTASVGVIPPSGTRAVPLRMAAWQRGYVLFLQAATVGPAGTELSSSAALIIR